MENDSLNMSFIQGDTIRIRLTALAGDGIAINLTGASIIFEMFDKSGASIIRKTTGDDIEIFDGENGIIIINLSGGSGGDTEYLSGYYSYEVQITGDSGNITTLTNEDMSSGKIYVRSELIK